MAPLPPSFQSKRFPLDDNNNNNTTVPQNTQMYGWTPEVYPNPLVDSARCGIDYLQEDANFTTNMRLCDPDWVLGKAGLDDIAKSLYNFSTIFGVAADTRHWEVVVENEEPSSNNNNNNAHNKHSKRQKSRRVERSVDKEKEKETVKFLRHSHSELETENKTMLRSDSLQERNLFGLNIFSPLTVDPDEGNSWVMVPPVELAVATVRKVKNNRCYSIFVYRRAIVTYHSYCDTCNHYR